MIESLLESLGPAPFRFHPKHPELRCASFTPAFKALAVILVASGCIWVTVLWLKGALGTGGSSGLAWFLTGLALMLYTCWHILTGRTQLDSEALQQTWVWNKKLELRELAYCKMIRFRRLDWLIAPRLYARTLLGKFAVFYAADPVMLSEFERLVNEVAEFRKMR